MSLRAVILSFAVFTSSLCFVPSNLEAASVQFGGLNFTVTNTESDGTASVSTDASTLTITGPNDGSGNPGTTDLTAALSAAGTVSFQWSYSSLDDPGADWFGYLLNGVFTQLADTSGESGSQQLTVKAGDIFGFEAASLDNTGEPGITTITDFTAPEAAGGTAPEPGSWALLLAGGALSFLLVRRFRLNA